MATRKPPAAAALAAAFILSIGVAPMRVAAEESAAPAAPAAERWAPDPAAASLAREKKLSMAATQRLIAVQQRAPELDGALTRSLGQTRYGGVWIGLDDRIKVRIVDRGTRPAVTRTVRARSAGLSTVCSRAIRRYARA